MNSVIYLLGIYKLEVFFMLIFLIIFHYFIFYSLKNYNSVHFVLIVECLIGVCGGFYLMWKEFQCLSFSLKKYVLFELRILIPVQKLPPPLPHIMTQINELLDLTQWNWQQSFTFVKYIVLVSQFNKQFHHQNSKSSKQEKKRKSATKRKRQVFFPIT